MDISILIKLSFLAFCFSFFSCKSDPEIDAELTETAQQNEWTDSIFGALSAKQQYHQHFIVKIPCTYQVNPDSLVNWIVENQPGGLELENWNLDSISYLKNRLDTFQIIQPFILSNFFELLDLPNYAYWRANNDLKDFSYLNTFKNTNCGILDFGEEFKPSKEDLNWLDSVNYSLGISAIVGHFSDQNLKEDFSKFLSSSEQSSLGLHLNIERLDTADLNKYRKMTQFRGIYSVKCPQSKLNDHLQTGADILFCEIEMGIPFNDWKGPRNEDEFQKSTKRILDQKSQLLANQKRINLDANVKFSRLNYAHSAVSIISNEAKILPLTTKFAIYSNQKMKSSQQVRKENRVSFSQQELSLKSVKKITNTSGTKVIFIGDSIEENTLQHLNELKNDAKTIVCFSNPNHYSKLNASPTLVFVPNYTVFDADILAQQLTGRIDVKGDFVNNGELIEGRRSISTKLARTVPEFTGLDRDTLNRINWAVNSALNGRAFPGCQVLLAKNGCIIYDKQFGHHSYQRQKVVTDESIYDLASLTKVVSTTLVGMKLYEMGAYKLKDSLGDYLPDSLKNHLRFPSTIKNITFEELFIHKSGMPAGFPIIGYMQYTSGNVGRFDKYYCDLADTSYCIEVAENFFLEREYRDSMWLKLNQIWLDKAKPYKYSDVNMNTLYLMFKSIIGQNPRDFGFTDPIKKLKEKDLFVEFLYKTFYKPLGMDRTRYKPLKHFDKSNIVPTEDEAYWRKQLLQGHVHDPNAALMGGIGGNAGMFSTTNDLAKYCQMLLNLGIYDGQRYLNAETVQKFTSTQEDSHRGLGFNKRTISTTGYGMADSSSIVTYGHTGFTGTCFWIDPEEDLVYIFLSNRVHPKVNNRIYQYGIRKRIHNTAYEARLN